MNLIALILGYLLGSIPTAYLIARYYTGKAEALEGGNIGTLNTIRRVGLGPGLAVAYLDIAKGAAAIFVAKFLLDADVPYVLGAGIMAVVGHNWMVWLRFKGGKGMATALGAIVAASLSYNFPVVPVIFIIIILLVWWIRRNLVLANAVGLLSLPAIVQLRTGSEMAMAAAAAVVAVIIIKYLPTAIVDYRQRGWAALGLDEIKPKNGTYHKVPGMTTRRKKD
ncbi:acyl-phosphate:glycerol-3-phosphate O-acyltransferase PlsY [Dehalogenimonas sp. WBC-2]|nr:acyl-phosphate:glycerol-3-phosphate O-acyltransferase PlsY [Dehalogenimonas sp. WBC-2]